MTKTKAMYNYNFIGIETLQTHLPYQMRNTNWIRINQGEILVDLPLHDRSFTWQNSLSKSRIDRCFSSLSAANIWRSSSLTSLPRGLSDHVPLLFQSKSKFDWGPKPFRSMDIWWDHPEFSSFVGSSWELIFAADSSLPLVRRLKHLRERIKTWNLEVFGDQNKKHADLIAEASQLDNIADSRALSDAEKDRFAAVKNNLWIVEKRLESLWLQKFRLNWTLKGDRNSKFFHTTASIHYRNNQITAISVGDAVFTEPDDIRFQIRAFYSSLYAKSHEVSVDLSGLDFKSLSSEQAACLICPFHEDEIIAALNSCNETKAPGPDGFNYYFYKRAWQFLKKDLLDFFNSFHSSNRLPAGLNSSFMVLIPKVLGSSNISDYRPISLVNGIYKLLSKCLSARLAPLLPSVVSEHQHAFIKERSIMDCSMIANELTHLPRTRKDKILVFKLDFHKAFDSLDWNYLLSVMKSMSFPDKWLAWMSNCLSSAFTYVLVNGSPIEPFMLKRGVRQGDLISPYLFVLAAEGLKCILHKAIGMGLINGFQFSDVQDPISVLQFADDTVLFLPFDLHQLRNLTRILRCFELISGLKINFHKSSLLGINVSDAELCEASELVGCYVEKFPIKYLGLPLAIRRIPVSAWDPVIQRFKSKLSLWKGNLLSPAGRLVLLKSVLYSLPIYFMSILGMPICIQNQLDSYMRKFLWKGDTSSSRVFLQNFLEDFNRNSLWFKVISSCSSLTSWDNLLLDNANQLSFIWKGIRKLCCLDSTVWSLFVMNMKVNIRSGDLTSLWHDNWSGNGTAAVLFSRLYQLSNCKQAKVSSVMAFGWRWRRRLRVGEKDKFSELHLLFEKACNASDSAGILEEDEFVWKLEGNGFTVASMANLLKTAGDNSSAAGHRFSATIIGSTAAVNRMSAGDPSFTAFRKNWCSEAPPRIVLNINSGYGICGELETQDHIFLHCIFARKIWCELFLKLGISWVMPSSFEDFFIQWTVIVSNKRTSKLWTTIWIIFVWEIWKCRNKRVFQHVDLTTTDVVF
ncbi:uncharacterized protein LOC126662059 [Mercurialis annua]|uniref:uncharacterized protein LOC126662059 n=1 Tax=Mercurialis annua TaxID=3986 RepID=UPI00216071F4|nr:uncharacterized protein LOC126662059 [Mercurialis annua]